MGNNCDTTISKSLGRDLERQYLHIGTNVPGKTTQKDSTLKCKADNNSQELSPRKFFRGPSGKPA